MYSILPGRLSWIANDKNIDLPLSLTNEEILKVTREATKRSFDAVKNNCNFIDRTSIDKREKDNRSTVPTTREIIGCVGEAGFCSVTNVPWIGQNSKNYSSPDVGICEIRCTEWINGRLSIRPADIKHKKLDRPYILMYGISQGSFIGPIGWLYGREIKALEQIDNPKGKGMKWNAYMHQLHSFDTLDPVLYGQKAGFKLSDEVKAQIESRLKLWLPLSQMKYNRDFNDRRAIKL